MTVGPAKKTLGALLLAVVLLALPAAAQATLTFTRGPLHPVVYVAADNGKGVRKIGPGGLSHVTPDGQSVVYLREGPGHAQEMVITPVAGGPKRTLLPAWREPFQIAFSPNSTTIAALRGPELGKSSLVAIDIASGAETVLAKGFFNGFSFSPDGRELAFSRASSERFPPVSDIFRVPIAGGKAVALTHDHASEAPLWGPTDKIVFVKLVGAKTRKYGPKNDLYLIGPDGKGLERLTHGKVDPLLQGLFPTAWSSDGSKLLAEFEGQDTSYAVAVNPKTGGEKPIGETGEQGFVGASLSRDGTLVLGSTGGFDVGSAGHDVATIPYGGGKPKVLARNAYNPDWSR